MTTYLRQRMRESAEQFRTCEYKTAKIVLALLSAACSAAMLRTLATIIAAIAPSESWAAVAASQIVELSGLHFSLTAGIAAFGGASSLFHELRQDITKFSIASACGHMVLAQFAGMLAYLLATYYLAPITLALVACGLAGWGGGAAIARINAAAAKRLGIE